MDFIKTNKANFLEGESPILMEASLFLFVDRYLPGSAFIWLFKNHSSKVAEQFPRKFTIFLEYLQIQKLYWHLQISSNTVNRSQNN